MQYITGTQVLTADGWQSDWQVGVRADGHIGYCGPAQHTQTQHVDLLLPAPVNLHSHTFQRAMSGLTERRGPDATDSFWTWRNLMYRFLDQLTPDQIQAIATLAFMEMAEAGFAGVAEFHYLHHGVDGVPYDNLSELAERIVAAAETVGFGLTLLPVLYQFGGCDGRELQGGQRRFGNDTDQFVRLHEGAGACIAAGPADYSLGVAPHSLRAVNRAGLDAAIALQGNGPIHMHLAEQVAEVDEFLAQNGARPAQWLLDTFDINTSWCLIHCTQMDQSETVALAKTGAVAGLCPITEANLGDGIFNGTDYLQAGGRIGFGSDSNVHIALFEELKALEYSQRLRDRCRAALAEPERSTGAVLYGHAAQGGAQAAGRKSGAIAAGQLADLVALSTDNQWINASTGDTALDVAIFGGHGQDCITDVWSAGRHIVQDGQHPGRDAIIRNYRAAIAGLTRNI